jgi:hypothetical protein
MASFLPLTSHRAWRVFPPVFGRSQSGGENSALCREVLDQVLRQTVISRLRLAHWEAAAPAFTEADRPDPAQSAAALATMLSRGTQAEVDATVEALLRLHDIDTLVLEVLPAADRLGGDHQEAGDHAAATLAASRLQDLIERLSPIFQAAARVRPHGHRVLLGQAEPHGRRVQLQLTEECLLRDGWDVWCEPRQDAAELTTMVRDEWFAMAALDATDVAADQLARLVRGLRRASCNRQLRVMLISRQLASAPDRLARLGADAAASDLRHACAQAERLLALMPAKL